MPQVFVRPEAITGDRFSLDPKESHHVLNVLRKKAGDEIEFFDGRGRRFVGELTGVDASSHGVQGRIRRELPQTKQNVVRVLYQGLPKGSKFDYVIEKAVELGVDRIVPFTSEKNPIERTPDCSVKRARWERLIEAASKQCGRSTLPTIEGIRTLDSLMAPLETGFSLVFSQSPDSQPLKELLAGADKESLRQINLLVGPESGFSAGELSQLSAAGGHVVSLGELVLRTETAGLVALSLVNYELGLL